MSAPGDECVTAEGVSHASPEMTGFVLLLGGTLNKGFSFRSSSPCCKVHACETSVKNKYDRLVAYLYIASCHHAFAFSRDVDDLEG